MKGFFVVLTLSFLMTGCAVAPTSHDRTSPQSLEMEVRGCAVETYVSEGGRDAEGTVYDRFGRVFYYPDKNLLVFNPDFGWMSGAIALVTLGAVLPDTENARAAFLQSTDNGGWKMMLFNKRTRQRVETGIVSKQKRLAAKRGAVWLQSGKDPGDCVRFE
jgi:hypothetical protein